ncbi:MAG TPA: hypothetical protein VK741_25530 [Acetobacteraceae bacterium]|jgi:hypothetical protein|nr:hypothetical protein [Acetobacteraceae bacterium]
MMKPAPPPPAPRPLPMSEPMSRMERCEALIALAIVVGLIALTVLVPWLRR